MIYGILIGILCTLIVVFALYIVYTLGKKSGNKQNFEKEVDYNQEQKEKRMTQGFNNVIYDYDIDVAMGRREQQ